MTDNRWTVAQDESHSKEESLSKEREEEEGKQSTTIKNMKIYESYSFFSFKVYCLLSCFIFAFVLKFGYVCIRIFCIV